MTTINNTTVNDKIRDDIYCNLYRGIYDENPIFHTAFQELWDTIDNDVNNKRLRIKEILKREHDTNNT